jgi:hypothetical protein
MSTLLSWFGTDAGSLGIFGAAIAFIWSVVRFMLVRQRDYEAREFKIYHRLIKELVCPDPESKATWIDRQAAVIFELRRFKRYYEVTSRMLQGLKQNEAWSKNPRLMEEIDLTLSYICERMPSLSAHATTRGG